MRWAAVPAVVVELAEWCDVRCQPAAVAAAAAAELLT